MPDWPRLLQHPYFCFVMVLLGWGLSEYLMVVSGKKLSVFTALFYNCVGPATLLFCHCTTMLQSAKRPSKFVQATDKQNFSQRLHRASVC